MRLHYFGFAFFLVPLLYGGACAPRQFARPRISPRPAPPVAVIEPAPPPVISEPEVPPAVLEESRIREEDLKSREGVTEPEQPVVPQEQREVGELQDKRSILAETLESPGKGTFPALGSMVSRPVDDSLITRITPEISPQRAASLRLAEEGRKLLENGEHLRALSKLEKSIAVDSSNPYGYYYLARAHFLLTNYKASLDFLEISESMLAGDPNWLARVFASKGENFAALGHYDRADANFIQALKQDPQNREALAGISQIRGGSETLIR